MNGYKSPRVLSYNCYEIMDIVGPCQAASTTFKITGGWDSAYNTLTPRNVQIEYSVTDIRLAYQDIKTLNSKEV